VLEPLKVVIQNYPEGQSEEFNAPSFPHDVGKEGSRMVPFGREIYIERADFQEEPAPGFKRLAPEREIRLRHAYFIKCERVIKSPDGRVVELHCSYDPDTRGGQAPDGRKVKGTIHWVSVEHGLPAELRVYDRLFTHEFPGTGDTDFLTQLNPNSLLTYQGVVEPSVGQEGAETTFQFERQGYFCIDCEDSGPSHLVFNRIVALRDSWTKSAPQQSEPTKTGKTRKKEAASAPLVTRTIVLNEERAERYAKELALSDEQVQVLAGNEELGAFFDAAVANVPNAKTLATWVVNELQGALKGRKLNELQLEAADMAALVTLVEDGTINNTSAKEVLSEMVASGKKPAQIVRERSLTQMSDTHEIEAAVQSVLDQHPDEVARFKSGEARLLGFFIGQVMRSTGGKANPGMVQQIVKDKLA
jgi:glutaminyl-tRNA synthetase